MTEVQREELIGTAESVPPTAQVLPSVLPAAPLMQLECMRTSLDVNTVEGRVQLINAMSPGTLSIEPAKALEMRVTDYVIYRDTVVDEESGEVSDVTRTVLIGLDGQTVRTTAAHMPQRIATIAAMFKPADWRAGIPIRVVQRMGKRGRAYHDVQLVSPSPVTTNGRAENGS